ncbi:MAG: LL-diaminopimelate aminotransferase [Candidatus Omnitrophica bacterium]|nr:LL-diaminopimelate aminotransferase [Candidatus Omnitrophota bacterium]
MKFNISKRLKNLPPYLFIELDKAKRKAKKEGYDIIDLGVGDPDQPTPSYIVKALQKAVEDPTTHRYALDQGMPGLRQAIADWYLRRFRVRLNPETEVLPLIGSKEGIAHFPLAFLNEKDYALIPDPCYPPYKGGVILAGGIPYPLSLLKENKFLPELDGIPRSILKKAKLIFVNYPNNPTSAIAEKDFYRNLVEFATKNRIMVISDLAYSEIAYDGYRPGSFLEIAGAKDIGIEFHSLSKTYNMTGWRIGWACGNKDLIAGLAKIKSNIDSGIFSAIQLAGITALEGSQQHIKDICSLYQRRRDILVSGLRSLGWEVDLPKATFYLWVKIPKKIDSIRFAQLLLEKTNVVVTPGVGFGKSGEGYIRMALTVSEERITQAVERIRKVVKI